LYTNVGNNFVISFRNGWTTGPNQWDSKCFALAGFGNVVKYQLNDACIGLEYKFRIEWTNKPGLYAWYDLISQQNSGDRLLPRFYNRNGTVITILTSLNL
jgi:hypothetical protein